MSSKSTSIWLFIDESGDLGHGSGTRYFVVTVLYAPIRPNKIYKPVVLNALKEYERITGVRLEELKASRIRDKSVIREVLKQISELNIRFSSSIYDIASNVTGYLHKEQGEIYLKMLVDAIWECKLEDFDKVYIILDARQHQNYSKQDFSETLKYRLEEKFPGKTITVSQENSNKSYGLQIVDIVSWAVRRMYEHSDVAWWALLENIKHDYWKTTILEPRDLN